MYGYISLSLSLYIYIYIHTHTIHVFTPQDEEVGDGTTSVIILAGEMLSVAEPLLEKNLHPTLIVSGCAALGFRGLGFRMKHIICQN